MRSQPKYNFFKNTHYALKGLSDIFTNEKSFKIEVFIIIPLCIVSLFLPVSVAEHILLAGCLALILIIECINSAIERVVDLVTKDFTPLAGAAKDAGSAAVFITIIFAIFTWIMIFLEYFGLKNL